MSIALIKDSSLAMLLGSLGLSLFSLVELLFSNSFDWLLLFSSWMIMFLSDFQINVLDDLILLKLGIRFSVATFFFESIFGFGAGKEGFMRVWLKLLELS
jgi:hypothetical protein